MALAQLHTLIRRAQERGESRSDQNEQSNDFVEGFRHFRQGHAQRAGSVRPTKLKPIYSVYVVCLDGPDYTEVNSGIIRKMNEKSLGSRKLKIKRSASKSALLALIAKEFKLTCTIQKLMRAVKEEGSKNFKLSELTSTSVSDIKSECSRSKIYVLPVEQINKNNTDSSDEDQENTENNQVQDVSMPVITRPNREQRSSHIRALAVIANATADLMENSGDEDLPDPAFTISNQVGRHEGIRSGTNRHMETSSNVSTIRRQGGPRESIQEAHAPIGNTGQDRTPTSRHDRTSSSMSSGRSPSDAIEIDSPAHAPRTPRGRQSSRGRRNGALSLRGQRRNRVTRDVTPNTPSSSGIVPPSPDTGASNITVSTDDSQENGTFRYTPAGTPTVLFSTGRQPIEVQHQNNLMDVTRNVLSTTNEIVEEDIPDVIPFGDIGQIRCQNDFKDILKNHRDGCILQDPEESLHISVRRENVVEDAITMMVVAESNNNLNLPIRISFLGEDGVDLGGLRREFWSLFLHQITHSSYVTGMPGRHTFSSNYMGLRTNFFKRLGQITALSILQDGPGLPIFSEIVTDYILTGTWAILNIDDLSNNMKDAIKRMEESTDADIKNIYSQNFDEASDAGFMIPPASFTRRHIDILKAACIEAQVSKSKASLDQFIEGLAIHDVIKLLRRDENIVSARTLFLGRTKTVTVADLLSLIRFNYNSGSSLMDERAPGQGFTTFIQATKGTATEINGIQIRPKDVLMWLTGAAAIPAIGFHKKIHVEFGDRTFVNTCALALTLKKQPNLSPLDAISYYTSLVINSQTFGQE